MKKYALVLALILAGCSKQDYHQTYEVQEVHRCLGESYYEVICYISAKNTRTGTVSRGDIMDLVHDGDTVYKRCSYKSEEDHYCWTDFYDTKGSYELTFDEILIDE